MRYVNVAASEKGSALVMAIMVLCILTVLGISALTTTNVDLQIASNERAYVNEFYVADSGWKESADWIDKSNLPPQRVNGPGDDTVKNFGGGFQNLGTDLNNNFPNGTEDRSLGDVPTWQRVVYENDTIIPGESDERRLFQYMATSNANRTVEIDAGLSKVYKLGY